MNILLPIETINREMDYKLMLGSRLSGHGHKIYIGQHDFLMSLLLHMEGGLYIGKNIFHKTSSEEDGSRYYQLKNKGFDIIYLHEEGGVFPGDQNQWRKTLESQYNPAIFDDKDRLCVWGEFQKEFDQARSKKVPIHVVGHPRFDLYKPQFKTFYQEEVENLQGKYSNYILINGNYSWANHGRGLQNTFPESINSVDLEARLMRVHYFQYFTSQMVAMVELTHILAVKFPDLNFIYRPHPSENHQYYKTVFNGVSNIIVNHEGPVNPWILGAKALIHDGCTTAIEATIAEIPVINYKPIFDPKCDIWLANTMGVKATTLKEVIALIESLEVSKKTDFKVLNLLPKRLLFNLQGDSFSAFNSVIQEKIEQKNLDHFKSPSRKFIQYKFAKIAAKVWAQKILQPQKSIGLQYHATKFYGFNQRVIISKIARTEKLYQKNISWYYHNQNLITIE
ncbi:surface carbohydrate biosynthesis protein [Lunatimonas salinarum]|uniref:surface carbohydrate biosynthesis protein n=1 Tax=Lunatimonas salinarum TaxID=1774590 RepID=UPI001AE0979F|nr:surface carbohydrate biosynthesis protein [Lunatimonas salinarum]